MTSAGRPFIKGTSDWADARPFNFERVQCATRDRHGHVGEPTGASLEAETSVDSLSAVTATKEASNENSGLLFCLEFSLGV